MFSTTSIELAKIDFIFATNLVIVSNLVEHYLLDKELFNDKWLLTSFALILSFVFHALITFNMIKIDESNIKLKKTVDDLTRFGTIFIVSEIFYSIFAHGKIKLSKQWAIKTSLTLFGIVIFNFFLSNRIRNLGPYTLLFYDVVKMIVGSLTSAFFIDGVITNNEIGNLFSLLAGYISWHLIIVKNVVR